MKKLLLIAFIAASGFTAHAQQAITASKVQNINTDTTYMAVKIPGNMDVVSFQIVQTKDSGTIAGYAILQGSMDGINYANISADTLTFANVAVNTKLWTFSPSPYSWYRIASYSVGGTQASKAVGYYIARKK